METKKEYRFLIVFILFFISWLGWVHGKAISRPFYSLSPPYRSSHQYQPTLSINPRFIGQHEIFVEGIDDQKKHYTFLKQVFSVPQTLEVQRFKLQFDSVKQPGSFNLKIQLHSDVGNTTLHAQQTFEIVFTNVISTRLLDGAWIDLYHYSEQEGTQFNSELRKMTNQLWRDEIQYMAEIGVRVAIIQALFFNDDKQVNHHNDTCHKYFGLAFYPSEIYPARFNFTDHGDKVEAILSAADDFGVKIYMGVGLYAWRDFTPEALCWSINVAQEVFLMYGHHPSFYGWYLSPEMFATFAGYPNSWLDLLNYVTAFRSYSKTLDPLFSVMLAVNTQGFESTIDLWRPILSQLDVVTPFYFPDDRQKFYVPLWVNATEGTICQAWIDMELFQRPITDEGLIPKSMEAIAEEIPLYDPLPNLVGYEFTGLMDSPNSSAHLGGNRAAKLYSDYQKYYKQHQ